MRHILFLFITLVIFWLVNSGHYTGLILSLGLVSIIFVMYLVHKMRVVDDEAQPTQLLIRLPSYLLWLLKEIILANIAVVKHIWLGNSSISPSMRIVKASQKTDLGKVIYANAITLTPGTVTVDLKGDEMIIHGLLESSLDDLEQGAMDQRTSQLEGSC